MLKDLTIKKMKRLSLWQLAVIVLESVRPKYKKSRKKL